MRRVHLMVGAVIALAVPLAPVAGIAGGGGEQTGRYFVGATPGVSVVCCSNEATGGGVGGYQFPAFDGLPKNLSVSDAVTGTSGIGYTVCQTIEAGGPEQSCGDAGTVSIGGCTGSDGVVDLRNFGFQKNLSTAVFIRMADPDCENQAVTGELVLTYS